MHSLLIQRLIVRLDREFSPEEHKQLIAEAEGTVSREEMNAYWEISDQLDELREALREKFGHPHNKYMQRQMVKEVLDREAARANEPRLPISQHPDDETPVDWQPRSVSVKIV